MDWLSPNPFGLASNPQCPRGLEVQTLLFPRPDFTESAAKAWAKSHDMRYGKVDSTANYHRLRQREPEDFVAGSFRTIDFEGGDGIKAVVACPKRGKESN